MRTLLPLLLLLLTACRKDAEWHEPLKKECSCRTVVTTTKEGCPPSVMDATYPLTYTAVAEVRAFERAHTWERWVDGFHSTSLTTCQLPLN